MSCVYDQYSNIGTLCLKDGLCSKKCDFPFKQFKCRFYREYNYSNVIKIEEKKVKKDRTEEAYKLYWEHVEPKDVQDKELKERLIEIIISEERANENWRLYK
jgi:hypothetical protein